MEALPYIIAIAIFGLVAGLIGVWQQHRHVKSETVKDVYTVNQTTFAGDDAENQARAYADMLISHGYPAKVTIPDCEPMDAGDVWEL